MSGLIALFTNLARADGDDVPRVTGIVPTSGSNLISVSWQTGPELRQLQRRRGLSGGWENVGAPTVATNVTVAAGGGLWFYRVGRALAQPGADALPKLVGLLPSLGAAHDVQVRSNLVYAANDQFGLSVLDLSDPLQPRTVAAASVPFDGAHVVVAGSNAFVTGSRTFYDSPTTLATRSGFYVFDADGPGVLALKGSLESAAVTFGGLAVAGSNAFVACGLAGLRAIDVRDPARPKFVGTNDTPGWASSVALSGDYAYVADGLQGLQILDVRNPRAPTRVGGMDTPGSALDVAVVGTLAYVADMNWLQIIDVSNPAAPTVRSSVPVSAWAVRVDQGRAYLAGSTAGLSIFDVTDAARPARLATLPPSGPPGVMTVGLAVGESKVYLADTVAGVTVVDLTNAATPSVLVHAREWFQANRVASRPGLAAVTGVRYRGGGTEALNEIRLVDTSGTERPAVLGSLGSAGLRFLGAALAVERCFVACGPAGLVVLDISDPAQPKMVATNDTPGWANAVGVAGSYACVADGLAGLVIFDLRTPQPPVRVGALDTPGNAQDVTLVGALAYVADMNSLQIVDLSAPAAPTIRGAIALNAWAIKVRDGMAYIAGSTSGLTIVDVRNPARPIRLGNVAPSGPPGAMSVGVAVSGSTAFLANTEGGLAVIDVSNPALPKLQRSVLTVGTANGVALDANAILAADSLAGVVVFDFAP